MTTKLGIILGSLLISTLAIANPVKTTGPDFVNATPKRHIDRSLVASPDAKHRIDPYDVVAFQFDAAMLSDVGVAQVDTAARWLKAHPRHRIVLEGHTDAIGLAPYNEDLATRRIAVIRERLLRLGVPSDRIVMITFGEREAMDAENPLHPADRRVAMYATELSPQAVIAMTREERDAIVASYTERGALIQYQNALATPTRTITTRR